MSESVKRFGGQLLALVGLGRKTGGDADGSLAGTLHPALKSSAFRTVHEGDWRRLDTLVTKARKKGIRALSNDEVLALPRLYRGATASLAVARSISLDRALIDYLETLTARAFMVVYGPRQRFFAGIARFLTTDWPRAVRSLGPILLLSSAAMAGGMILSGFLFAQDQSWFYSFMPDSLASGRTPAADTEFLRNRLFDGADADRRSLSAFAGYLFVHNTLISLFAFTLGIAFGIPAFVLMLYNGLAIGAFIALYMDRGLGVELGGWLLVHGVTELLAVCLAGAAGMALGWRVAFPGRLSRRHALAEAGPKMGRVMVGVMLMLALAGIIEAFIRQLVTDTGTRYLFALITAIAWASYFLLAGREDKR